MVKHKIREEIKQFPQISRFFPATKYLSRAAYVLSLLIVLILFSINVVILTRNFLQKQQEKQQALNILLSEKQKWEKVVAKYSDYRDGYYQLAAIEYQLNNNEKAKEYLQKALAIDPNFKEGNELKNLLGF